MGKVRLSVGMIVFNTVSTLPENMMELCVRSIYPFAEEILIVEGATRASDGHYFDGDTSSFTKDGHSNDGTLDVLRRLESLSKVKVIYGHNFWSGKTTMANAYARLATGTHILQLDSVIGDRTCFIKDTSGIKCLTLEELFDHYKHIGINKENGKEIIRLEDKNIETLTPYKVEYTSRYIMGKLLQQHDLTKMVELTGMSRDILRSRKHNFAKMHEKNNHIIHLQWVKLNYIMRHEVKNKDIVRLTNTFGETVVTTDHSLIEVHNGEFIKTTANDTTGIYGGNTIPSIPLKSSIMLSDYVDCDILDGCIQYRYAKGSIPRKSKKILNRLTNNNLLAFCRILGAYVSEGSQSKWETTLVSNTDFDWIQEIQRDFESITSGFKLGIRTSKTSYKTGYALRLCDCNLLGKLLVNLCGRGSKHKTLPTFLYDLEDKYVKAFLDSYIKGDGHIYENGAILATTISNKLAAGLCYIYKRLGKSVCITTGKSSANNTVYNVHVNKTDLKQLSKSPTKKEHSKFTGYVYDLGTESHMFVDGCGMILLHNSDEFYHPEDMEKIIHHLEDNPQLSEIDFYANHFVGGFNLVIDETNGAKWGNDLEWRRVFRHTPGKCRWLSHEPPVYLNQGFPTYSMQVCRREETLAMGIRLQHYSYVTESQFRFKEKFYRNPEYGKAWDRYMATGVMEIFGIRPKAFTGEHPAIIKEAYGV